MAQPIKIFGPDSSEKITAEDLGKFVEITKRYRNDESLQQKYGHIYAYMGACGVDVPAHLMDPPAARPDVDGYIASMSRPNLRDPITEAQKGRVHAYADTWQTHADIRNEFRRFESYASYMRFKEAGRIRRE